MHKAFSAALPGTPEFTPFGYLRNPGHRARSWSDVEGGNLRTPTDWLGLEWVYPLQRDPSSGAGIEIDRPRHGLSSHYHSALILGFDWPGVEVRCFLVDNDALCVRTIGLDITPRIRSWGELPQAHSLATSTDAHTRVRYTVLARADSSAQASENAYQALQVAEARYQQLLDEDAAFAATCPALSGDWPAGWPEGFWYDLQTTRLLVQPPGGIFHDVWPAWMVAWPRVVLAEGALDMLRLAYADPALAKRAVLSMFRDAPMPNVPCVFEDGGYNMLAADGSRCGTSPAWCLPFLNLELLYLRTLDRDWLRTLFPYLVAYLDFWLGERVDGEGWVVYKCTWESGEDGNPRLDPSGSGEGVIERRVRPVELQATMAHAANVMRFFAQELGLEPELPRWIELEANFRARTRQLFDPELGRYRDWLVDDARFQAPMPDQLYWGTDTGRFSPLGLTPLLIGEPLPERELWLHARAPWTWWPSWTYALVECAAAAGIRAGLGTLVADIVDRVYAVTTRHELGDLARPLPGAAPEFWPEDWATYQGHDGYGWGATTANLVLRHLIGFRESRDTQRWTAHLAPALPASFLEPGRRYALRTLLYRGLVFDLGYTVTREALEAELDLRGRAMRCQVRDALGKVIYASDGARSQHAFAVANDGLYTLRLDER